MNNEKSGPEFQPETTQLFRTPTQMRILAKIVLDEKVSTISELARFAGVYRQSAGREVARLVRLGYVSTSTQGSNTLVTNQLRGEMLEAVTTLLMRAAGPVTLAPRAFAALEGLERLFIIGSWAARYSGREGRPPGDIDIVLLGKVNPSDASEVAEALRKALDLGLKVQIFVIDPAKWDDPTNAFWVDIKAKPVIDLTPSLEAARAVE